MTVITPAQRQLIFTKSFSASLNKKRRGGVSKFLARISRSGILDNNFAVAALSALLILSLGSTLFWGADAVLLSFKIKTLAHSLEAAKTQRESLEVQQAQILSLESLKSYASMVNLTQADRVSYLLPGVDQLAKREAVNLP